jgi:hypothetical protein
MALLALTSVNTQNSELISLESKPLVLVKVKLALYQAMEAHRVVRR